MSNLENENGKSHFPIFPFPNLSWKMEKNGEMRFPIFSFCDFPIYGSNGEIRKLENQKTLHSWTFCRKKSWNMTKY